MNLFEGDIDLAEEEKEKETASHKRNAHRDRSRLWRTKRVPYVITEGIGECSQSWNEALNLDREE